MKLHLRAVAVVAVGASLGTAACYQLSGLDDYNNDNGDASVSDASNVHPADGGAEAGPDAAPNACADNACNISCGNGFTSVPSGLTCSSSGVFVEAPGCDAGSSVCTTVPQCGCGADSTCQLVDSLPMCGNAGPLEVHTPCTGEGQCKVGLACVDSVCLAFCNAESTSCAVGDTCTAIPGSNGGTYVCLPTCNPLDSTPCPTPQTNCSIASDFNQNTACVTAGTAGAGADCNTSPIVCAQGLVCTGTGANAECRFPVALDAGCGAGSAPTQFYDAGFGYCLGDGG